MLPAVCVLKLHGNISWVALLKMLCFVRATLNHAMILKRHCAQTSNYPIGVLEVGATAGLVFLNGILEVLGTVVDGAVASGTI